MLTIEDILAVRMKDRRKIDEADLRRLPYRKAFIYGRLSTPGQVRESKESLREIATLVTLCKEDGFQTGLDAASVETWLLAIRSGIETKGVKADGDVIVDVQDFGLSGQLSADRRPGLENLRRGLEAEETGAVYVTEGVSRLSRDQNRVIPFQLLKLLKERQCRLRTPEGVWNPAVDKDWEALAEEFEDAIGELKVFRKRMHRRKAQKAARGEFVGEPVPPGFFLPTKGQKANGRWEFGKMEPYEPHTQVLAAILREYVKQQGSKQATVRALGDLTFPFFPPELAYMRQLSALRACRTTRSGYRITPDLVRGLAKNPKLIGIWQWGDNDPIPNNHEAAVPEDLFLAAYELAVALGKPKGRTVKSEPLEWSGILWCCNHPEPAPISNHASQGEYRCQRDYVQGQASICLDILSRLIDEPLTTEVLRQLDFTPYAQEVLAKLESQVTEDKVEYTQYARRARDLEQRMENLKGFLGCGDVEREEVYWEQYKTAKDELDRLRSKPVPKKRSMTPDDIDRVRDFLSKLPEMWQFHPRNLRNRLLKLLIERVELRHEGTRIEATIIWKAGLQQVITIHRPTAKGSREKRWNDGEVNLLKMLWPSSTREVLEAALPDRTWSGIANQAYCRGLRRQGDSACGGRHRQWSLEEETKAKALYESGTPIPNIVSELDRSRSSILSRAAIKGWKRPASARWKKAEVWWEAQNLELLQQESSIWHYPEKDRLPASSAGCSPSPAP